MFDKTKILVFGGFRNSSCRYNDVWVFDTITMAWEQPIAAQSKFTAEGNHVAIKTGMSGVPHPRGAHTASRVGNLLYIFGGYGGIGYSRRDFNDLHTLDLEEFKWKRLAPKGNPPLPRSGACSVQYGARSTPRCASVVCFCCGLLVASLMAAHACDLPVCVQAMPPRL